MNLGLKIFAAILPLFVFFAVTANAGAQQSAGSKKIQDKLAAYYDASLAGCTELAFPTSNINLPPEDAYDNGDEPLDMQWNSSTEKIIEECMKQEGFPVYFKEGEGIPPQAAAAARAYYLQSVTEALKKAGEQKAVRTQRKKKSWTPQKPDSKSGNKIYRYKPAERERKLWISP